MLPRSRSPVWLAASAAGFAVLAALVAATFDDYGITWDAHYHMANGKHVLAYYATGFADRTVLTYHNLYLYGGLFDLAVALANLVSPLGEYETAHLLNAAVGVIGIAGCWKLAHALAGPRAAFFAALLLALTPAWYGHMFNNPKDIPFAAAMAWSLYYMVRMGQALPVAAPGVVVKLGLALGLTLGMRVGGVVAALYLAAIVGTHLAQRAAKVRGQALREAGAIAVRVLLPVAALAYAVMLLCWPWAQQDPVANPVRALLLFSRIEWDLDVLFEGRLVSSLNLPADYLPVYFAIKLPEVVLALLLLAVPVGVGRLVYRREGLRGIRPAYVGLVVAVVFPFAYFILMRPVTYDGIRHFLFVLPPIAALAGILADRLLRGLRLPAARGAVAALLALGAGLQVATMVRLHPDQYVYYNHLIGGVKGAEHRYELDYWGNSYAEAVDQLKAYLEREAGGRPPRRVYRVAVCSLGLSAAYFFPPYLTLARDEFEADFYISVTRLDCDDVFDGDEIARVERDGATLSVVKDRRVLRVENPERMAAREVGRPVVRIHPGVIENAETGFP